MAATELCNMMQIIQMQFILHCSIKLQTFPTLELLKATQVDKVPKFDGDNTTQAEHIRAMVQPAQHIQAKPQRLLPFGITWVQAKPQQQFLGIKQKTIQFQQIKLETSLLLLNGQQTHIL